MTYNKKTLASLTLALLATTSTAYADNYTASSWVPASHVITQNHFDLFSRTVKDATKGNINFEVFSGGALLPPKGTLDGVKSGVAQYAYIAAAYQPSHFPYGNILNDLAFVSDDPVAAAFASTEISMTHPLLQKEYMGHDVVFASGYSTMTYNFICRSAARTLADLKGKKIRTAGSAHVKWVTNIGAIPVSVSTSELYSGLQRGSIDCTLADSTFLTSSFKLQEVAKFITTLNMGAHTSGGMIFNKDFWNDRSVEERKILLDAAANSLVSLETNWENEMTNAYVDSQKEGVEVIIPSKDMNTALTAFNANYIINLAANAVKDRKVPNPDALIKQYVTTEKKWKTLLAGVDRTNKDALLKLVMSEIYSKIDVELYGK